MKTNPQPGGSENPILVTGSHRSGTTWVGKMLCAGAESGYISEPLNVHHRLGVLRIPVQHWYTYICDDNQDDYLPAFQETLRFQYHPKKEITSIRSLKDFGRFLRDWNNFYSARRRNLRPLIKDPFAVFSAPWFHEKLNCQVVIVVRHPAPFASSLKRLGWSFDFSDLLAQPLLVRDRLGTFKSELEMIKDKEVDVIDQACLLWRIIYSNVAEYFSKYPRFKIVRHEDLSTSPVNNFQALYKNLGLTFDPRVEEKIVQTTNSRTPELEQASSPHNIRRNSLQNLSSWKQHLTQGEIARIEGQTEDIASRFYPEGSPV
jgi:hypothetical protein